METMKQLQQKVLTMKIDLNLEQISDLRKFDANYVIWMLKEDLFSEAGKQPLLEYLPFHPAADGDTNNESDGKGSGDS